MVDRRRVPLARLVGDLFGGALGDEVDAFGKDVGADVDEAFHVGHVEAEAWAGHPLPSFGLAEGWRHVFW
jgi:hypothetical protein